MQLVATDFQDQLIRGLSHRMNNILSVFHGYLGLMMDERKLDPVLKEGLIRIRGSATEATELVERVNAISRPTASNFREVRLADFFRQLTPSIDSLHRPGIQFSIECPEDAPLVRVDFSRMKLAILELVRNAFEAATSRVLIRVTAIDQAIQTELFPTFAETPAQQQVRIEVVDDGAGVPHSEARRIFEPFFSTKRQHQCAGLGLAVALGCTQQFGGTIQFHRREGETAFEMTLPALTPQRFKAAA